MNLQPEQLALLATIATVGVWLLTVIYSLFTKLPKPSANVMKVIVFVGATVLAYFWTPIALPPVADGIFEFVTALLVVATAVFKLAQLIYDVLWKPIVKWLSERTTALAFLSPSR